MTPRVVRITIVLVVALGGLVALWVGVRTGTVLAPLDPVLADRLAAGRPAWLVGVMVVVTDVGSPAAMISLLVAVTAAVAWRRRAWGPVVLAGSGLAALAAVDTPIKDLIARPRPPLALHASAVDGFSFPSGHAVYSAGVVLLVLALTHDVRGGVRWALGVVAGLVVAAVGASRLVLGVHYLSDVLAGWCLAVLAVGIVVLVAERLCGARVDPTGRRSWTG